MIKHLLLGLIMMITLMTAASCSGNHAEEQPRSIAGGNKVIPFKAAGSNVYFIKTDTGYIAVDAGLFGGEERITKMFKTAGISPKDIELIILTHGHEDHMGGLADIRKLTGARVLAHESLIKYLSEGKGEPVVPSNLKGKIMKAISPPLKLEKFVPELTMKDEYDLSPFGIKGKVIHTPGHSPGSVTIILDNGETLVGDQVRGTSKKLSLGMFYENKEVLIKSLEKVAAFNPDIIYMSHGTITDTPTLAEYLKTVR